MSQIIKLRVVIVNPGTDTRVINIRSFLINRILHIRQIDPTDYTEIRYRPPGKLRQESHKVVETAAEVHLAIRAAVRGESGDDEPDDYADAR